MNPAASWPDPPKKAGQDTCPEAINREAYLRVLQRRDRIQRLRRLCAAVAAAVLLAATVAVVIHRNIFR